MEPPLHQVSLLEDVDGDSVVLDLVHLEILFSSSVLNVQSVNLDIRKIVIDSDDIRKYQDISFQH